MASDILLCDDEVHILRAAEFKIRRAGYQVRTAGDGEQAWELMQEKVPDLLITDCQMPRLDGVGLVRRVRQQAETENLPILMLTAKGFELSREELIDGLGVLEIIPKPFSPRELLQRVETHLLDHQTASS